jgi:curved DNA-binding protein CbpA
MAEHIPSFYRRLGLGLGADEREVKRAYAKLLKTLNPELQAAEFEKLRSDYEQALAYVQSPEHVSYFDDGEFIFKNTEPELPMVSVMTGSAELIRNLHHEGNQITAEVFNTSAGFEAHEVVDMSNGLDNKNVNTAYQDASLAFTEFCQLIGITELASLSNQDVASIFRNFLHREALISLDARLHFENFLIYALADRYFGHISGRLLVASAAFFDWNTADSEKLLINGEAGYKLRTLLDNFFGLSDKAQYQLIVLSELPKPDLAHAASAKFEEYKNFSASMFEYFVDVEREQAWLLAKSKAPLLKKLNEKLKGIEKYFNIRTSYWLIVLVWIIYKFTFAK